MNGLSKSQKQQLFNKIARESGIPMHAGNPNDDGGEGRTGELPRPSDPPRVRFSDIGGVESALQDVRELIEYPLRHPEIYEHLGVEPPRGILLHGPPGCGKTLLANAIAGEMGVPFYSLAAPEVVSGMSGESEQKIRNLFKAAAQNAPSIIFIDEIDAITPRRENAQREMERRIVAQLLSSLDSLGNATTAAKSKKSRENSGEDCIDDDDDGDIEMGSGGHVVVIGATNRPDSLEPALRRAGRFDREIALGIPDAAARARILKVMASKLHLAGDFDFDAIARATGGFVGADLGALAKEAAIIAVHRIFSTLFDGNSNPAENASVTSSVTQSIFDPSKKISGENEQTEKDDVINAVQPLSPAQAQALSPATTTPSVTPSVTPTSDGSGGGDENLASRTNVSNGLRAMSQRLSDEYLKGLCITMEDFEQAIKKVQPSAKREGFSTIPNVKWSNVGALGHVRSKLIDAIVGPIKHPELYNEVGIRTSSGVLLYGPPGCGKTLIAKAVANECGANFIGIKGPQLLNKYVGEAERAVRQLFARAATSAPCVIFFDELDALCPRRASDGDSTGASRIVNQLLTEMDGLEARKDVFVIAATNRPDVIDGAMMRPGRLDILISVDLPDVRGREEILRAVCLSQKSPLGEDVDLAAVAGDPRCEGFSGADLAALVKDAALHVLHDALRDRGISLDSTSTAPIGQKEEGCEGEPKRMVITQRHLLAAFDTVSRSVSKEDEQLYKSLKDSLRNSANK